MTAKLQLRGLMPKILWTCWISHWLSGILLIRSTLAKDRYVYWNISNPIFKPSGANPFLVPKYDRVVFVCPTNGLEFYQLYWTQIFEATTACDTTRPGVYSLMECSTSGDSGAVQVTDFSPDPGAPTFDRSVYVFTTSTGDRAGIGQRIGGVCATRNMRLAIDIGDPNSITDPPASSLTTRSSTASAKQPTTTASTSSPGADRTRVQSPSTRFELPAQSTKQALSPTPQDLANQAQVNLIIASSIVLPSPQLVATMSVAAIAVLLHWLCD